MLKKSQIFLLILVLLLPLIVFSYFGYKVAEDETERLERELGSLIEATLVASDGEIQGFINRNLLELDRDFSTITSDNISSVVVDLIELKRRNPLVEFCFYQDSKGVLLYPKEQTTITIQEINFLKKNQTIFAEKWLLHENKKMEETKSSTSYGKFTRTRQIETKKSGFLPWFNERGLQLFYWQSTRNGAIWGCELNRARLLADLITILPTTNGQLSIQLLDSQKRKIYHYGGELKKDTQTPETTIALSYPLSSFSLKGQMIGSPAPTLLRSSLFLNLISTLLLAVFFLLLLFYLFIKGYKKEMVEASQRVSFVNRVSHELRTPLTNIRLHAELLEEDVLDEQENKRVKIIVSETHRLNRLIANILSFSRKEKNTLKLNKQLVSPDCVIKTAIDNFKPALCKAAITITTDLNAGEVVSLDSDVLEQILGNLISNVEKYASDGGSLAIHSEYSDAMLTIEVTDQGKGINDKFHKKIFQPFFRVTDKISEGVSGTGIGLAISRDLAILHGGTLQLKKSNERGSCFQFTLAVTREEEI